MDRPNAESVLANRDFRIVFVGSLVSTLGDQFTLVALPWLVLKLTNDPAALGLVLATMALPRALFMLIGGAVVDRMSSQHLLIAARAVNTLLVSLLAVTVLANAVYMSTVYAIALGIGLSTAFAYPAGSALLPQLVTPTQLPAANAAMLALRQVTLFVGPALAGMVIGMGPHTGHGPAPFDTRGLGVAFALDAVSFLVSLGSLLLIRVRVDEHPPAPLGSVLSDVAAGVRAVWTDLPLRTFILYAGVVTVFVGGPLQVGLPVLADTRLDLGATTLGILMAADSGGMLLGGLFARWTLRALSGRIGLMVLCINIPAGLGLATLSLVRSTLPGALLLVGVGAFTGIVEITIISWLQQRVPRERMGRTMSLQIFTTMGLGSISAAVAGSLLKVISVPMLFAGAGIALTAISAGCLATPSLRSIGEVRRAEVRT